MGWGRGKGKRVDFVDGKFKSCESAIKITIGNYLNIIRSCDKLIDNKLNKMLAFFFLDFDFSITRKSGENLLQNYSKKKKKHDK